MNNLIAWGSQVNDDRLRYVVLRVVLTSLPSPFTAFIFFRSTGQMIVQVSDTTRSLAPSG